MPKTGSHQIDVTVIVDADGATLLAEDTGKVYSNEGATALAVFTLPAAVVGMHFSFLVQDADGIQITAVGDDTIRTAGTVTGAAGNISSTTIGDVIQLVCINATEWVMVSGTWLGAGGASPLTTKGDVYTYDTADQRLAVGTNGQVLTADSAEATGVKWAAAGGGGATTDYDAQIASIGALGTETFTVSAMVANANIPGGFDLHYCVVNGLVYKIVTTVPAGRECRVTASTTIEVANVVIPDEVEFLFGV